MPALVIAPLPRLRGGLPGDATQRMGSSLDPSPNSELLNELSCPLPAIGRGRSNSRPTPYSKTKSAAVNALKPVSVATNVRSSVGLFPSGSNHSRPVSVSNSMTGPGVLACGSTPSMQFEGVGGAEAEVGPPDREPVGAADEIRDDVGAP